MDVGRMDVEGEGVGEEEEVGSSKIVTIAITETVTPIRPYDKKLNDDDIICYIHIFLRPTFMPNTFHMWFPPPPPLHIVYVPSFW